MQNRSPKHSKKNRYLQSLRNSILDFLKDEDIKIILFGSRAREEDHPFSDVDIGIIPMGKYDPQKITLLREYIEEHLNIPYKVEIVDLSHVSDRFSKEALKGAKVWKGSN